MENQLDVQTESSPVIEVPRDGAAYAEWRQTGKLPEAKPTQPKGESAPPKESSAEGEEPKGKSAPASETGNKDQEKQKPPRDNAATRLNELLDDLRKAGLTPAELKTFKREVKEAKKAVEQPKAARENRKSDELKPPTKPKQDDFATYAEFEDTRDKYFEEMADYKAAQKFQEFQQEQARNAAYQSVKQKLDEAKARYADDPSAVETISATSWTLLSDQQIPLAVKSIIDAGVAKVIEYSHSQKPSSNRSPALDAEEAVHMIRKGQVLGITRSCNTSTWRPQKASINLILQAVLRTGNEVDPSGFVAPGNNKLGKVAFLLTSEPSKMRFPLRLHCHTTTHPSGIVPALVLWGKAVAAPFRQTQIASGCLRRAGGSEQLPCQNS
jgi:hypothetical protein